MSSSVAPFSSCLQSFPASGSYQMNQFFTLGGESTGVSNWGEDGGGIGWGDHFLPYKFIERTVERWANSTKQLLIASRGHQVPRKVVEFQLQHQSFQRIFRVSFSIDWLDLLEVQGTVRSLLLHHSSKASGLWCSAFFMIQLSHQYTTTVKTIALTRQTFVGKVMSLLFNMPSRLVIAFLPRNKYLLISWLQSPSAVIFGAQENKVCHWFHCFPIYLPWRDGTRCHDLSFLNVKL